MTTQAGAGAQPRTRLTRERVLRAAVQVADESGIEALTMRRLGEELGTAGMALYYHVAKKDDILDSIVDAVATEINDVVDRIELPTTGAAWKAAMRHRILSAREVMLQHPWAPALFETRTNTSPAVLHYHDHLVGLMRDGGFSYEMAHRALHVLGSRSFGFTQELFNPGTGPDDEESKEMLASMAGQLPHLVGLMMAIVHDKPDTTLGLCDAQDEFEFGLDLILDGLDRMRDSA